MPRLRWDFARHRQWTWQWIAFGVIALSTSVHALVWRYQLLQERDTLITRLDESAKRLMRTHRPDSPPPPAALKQIFSEMRAPWIEMLDSLQRVTHPGVELISLEPESNSFSRVRISGVANRTEDVFDLVESLQKDHSWSSIQLLSQASTEERNAIRAKSTEMPSLPGLTPLGVSFSLLAEWKQS